MLRRIDTADKWCLALSGFLSTQNGCPMDRIAPYPRFWPTVKMHRQALARDWGIADRKTLYDILEWLEAEGHNAEYMAKIRYAAPLSDSQFQALLDLVNSPKQRNQWLLVRQHAVALRGVGIAAWDIGRYVWLCRDAYALGWIKKKETLQLIRSAGQRAQRSFDGWEHFGLSYVVGRSYWSAEAISRTACDRHFRHLLKLIATPGSPWARLAWRTPLNH